MKKFIGRKKELKVLNTTYEDKDAVVLISGPRRCGKTQLVRYFSSGKPTLFFTAREVSDKINQMDFLRALGETWNAQLDVPDWAELLKMYAQRGGKERRILVFDNFGALVQSSPGILKTLAIAWESVLKPNNVLLILIMSDNNVLKLVEEQKNPLIKEVSLRIKLKPVSFIEMLRSYKHRSYAELVSQYALTGGFPMYWSPFFDQAVSTIDQLGAAREHMLSPHGFFYNEPTALLEKDIWEPVYYTSVLSALAEGNDTEERIAKALDYKPREVRHFLENLELLGYVVSDVPVTDKKFKAARARWRFTSPVMRFWFKYVYPNRAALDNADDLKVYEAIKKDFPKYIQQPFRDVSEEMFRAGTKQGTIDFDVDRSGRFWNADTEIPIVAIDDAHKKLFFADTNYSMHPHTLPQFEAFVESCQGIKEFNRYKDYERVYGLFTVTRPENALMQYALNNDNIVLFNGVTLYRKTE